jgi:hypothetical protein
LAISLIQIALHAIVPPATARTWTISPRRPDAPNPIQEAAFLAAPGDTLLLEPGTYFGEVYFYFGVALIGRDGPEVTVLDAHADYNGINFQAFSPGEFLIQGVTVTGSHSWECRPTYGGCNTAALALQGDVEVRDCIIADNCAGFPGVFGSGDLRVIDTQFARNEVSCDYAGTGGIHWETGTVLIEGCTFEGSFEFSMIDVADGSITVRRSTIRSSYGIWLRGGMTEAVFEDSSVFTGIVHQSGRLLIRGCTLASGTRIGENAAEALFEGNLFEQRGPIQVGGPATRVEIRRNTFAPLRHDGTALAIVNGGANTIIEQNVFTGSRRGLHVAFVPGMVIRCNNSWGNETNWDGIPDLEGIDGNISADPLFCEPAEGDFTVAENSPVLPSNNSCGVQMGAFGAGCKAMPVEPLSWGRIKGMYRIRGRP